LSSGERRRLAKCPVKCLRLEAKIRTLADYLTTLGLPGPLWYRGHDDLQYSLTPSALRPASEDLRNTALSLLGEFRRFAEMKLPRPPGLGEDLRWLQLAQHYGLPTRLLDWTESPIVALHFACLKQDADGVVFMLNPIDLNRATFPSKPRILDQHRDAQVISKYFQLSGSAAGRTRLNTIAINPVWNSERIMAQKGVFTLHGTNFTLDGAQAPSLVAVPIFRDAKERLVRDLEYFGVDEMAVFPELEHVCRCLRKRAGL
jgi:hypothetical protein